MSARTDPRHDEHARPRRHGHDDGAHHGTLKGYMTGFVLSVILTAIPFWLVMGKVFANSTITIFVILGFAVVQIVVHMVYFLHMNSKAEGGWTMMSLIFTIVLVVITLSGSLWVMYHLKTNMMPVSPEQMRNDAQTLDAGRAAQRVRGGAGAAGGLARFAVFVALGTGSSNAVPGSWISSPASRQRVHAPAAAAARGRALAASRARRHEYRRVRSRRHLSPTTRKPWCRPSTRLGAGFWVLTPLRAADGSIVLVNRGFVPPKR